MAENETGWETPKVAAASGLPDKLPDPAKVEAKMDGELFRVGERKFRFTYSHWTEVKPRAPRTPKAASNGDAPAADAPAETPAAPTAS